MPITPSSSRTVDRSSHRAEDGLQSNKLCSRCAAIDFSAPFASESWRAIELGLPSTWKPRECEACDFFSRCSDSRNTHLLAPDVPLQLTSSRGYESMLGVVRQALPEAVLSANNSFCMIGEACDAFADNRFIVRSSEPMINITPPKIDWHPVNEWIQTDVKEEQRIVQGKASHGNTSLYPGLLPGKSSPLAVIDCQSREDVEIPAGTEYVTLSYVWGSGGAALESDCAAGTSSRMLPLTVEDSLLVCLELLERRTGHQPQGHVAGPQVGYLGIEGVGDR